MKLIVYELNTLVSQLVRPTKNTIVEAIRPHLYKHNFPLGSIVVEIQNQDGDLISRSNEVLISDISNADFFHGHIRFDVKAYLQKGIAYRICIKAINYEFSETAYMGVCNSYDLHSYPSEYSPSSGGNAPLDLQIWGRFEK